jgi:MFS family permease
MEKSTSLRSWWSRESGANTMIALLTFVLITGAALYGVVTGAMLYGASPTVPDPVPASAPPAEFSSGRALEHVRAIAQKPHPMDSPENAAVRDYLLEELSALGLKPEVQKTTAAYYPVKGLAQAGIPENVLARLEGTNDSGKAFLLMAHYDSVPTGPGASDDGAGVAAMLETLRALKAGPPLKNDVIFLFTEGEERGLLGARAFVDSHPWAKDVGVVLNLEARGHTGPAYMFETSDEGGWVVREFAKAAPYPITGSDSVAFYKRSGSNSDLSIFLDDGRTGLNVAYIQGLTHYHSRMDTAEELDEGSLQHMGSYALPLTRHFGNVSLDHTKAPDEIYFNIFRFQVHYPEGWAMPLMALAVLLFVGVAGLGLRRRRLTLGGVTLGFLALLGSIIIAALGTYLIWTLIRTLHPGGIWALEYEAPLFWMGFASLTVAITAALYVGFSKKIRVANLGVGALLWWLLLTAATTVLFPPASYLFTWPLLFSLLGLGTLFALGDQWASPWYPFAVLSISAIPATFLFAPGVYGVPLTRELLLPNVVPLFALVIVLMMGLLIPHLDLIAKPNKWVLPGAAAALGLGLLLFGSLTAGFDARHPKPNTILYALNTDTGQAIWESGDEAPDAWTSQFLGTDARKGSVADYLDEREALHSEAPTVALEAPNVALLDDGTRDGVRTLRMRVTAPPANLIVVEADAEAHVVGAAVNGKRVPEEPLINNGGLPTWTLHYWNPPSEGVDLTLEVKATEPLTITARAGTPGLPAIPGKTYRDRPPDTMPIASDPASVEQDNSTVVSKSFTFAQRPGNEESK